MPNRKTAAAVPEDVLTKELAGPFEVEIQDEAAFFRRVQQKIADRKKGERNAPAASTISFESLSAFIDLVTPQRARLFETLRAHGAFESVTALANALHRDRGTVSKDVRALADAGILRIKEKALPGHGKSLSVESVAEKLYLQL